MTSLKNNFTNIFYVKQLCLFILLIFLQVIFFSKICLFGVVTPLIYIYFIIQLPGTLSRNIVFLLAALLGCSIDIFYHTLGIHLLSCIIIGFLRFYLLQLLAINNLYNKYLPSIFIFGKKRYFFYSFLMVFVHQIVLFSIELFSFLDFFQLILQIIGSGCFTLFIIFTIEIAIASIRNNNV